jgi:hypothetical protein
VCAEMPSSCATSRVVAPYATRWRIWVSRRESGASGRARSVAAWNSSNSARVSEGWITGTPSTALRAASTSSRAPTSLSR